MILSAFGELVGWGDSSKGSFSNGGASINKLIELTKLINYQNNH